MAAPAQRASAPLLASAALWSQSTPCQFIVGNHPTLRAYGVHRTLSRELLLRSVMPLFVHRTHVPPECVFCCGVLSSGEFFMHIAMYTTGMATNTALHALQCVLHCTSPGTACVCARCMCATKDLWAAALPNSLHRHISDLCRRCSACCALPCVWHTFRAGGMCA